MKRDMELVRKILLHMENDEFAGRPYEGSWIDGVDETTFFYHVNLMEQANLIKATSYKLGDDRGIAYYPIAITWDGHEFLDAVRDNGVWSKVKKKVGPAIASMPIKVITTVASAIIQQDLGV